MSIMFIESNQIRCIICASEYGKPELRCPKCGFPVFMLSSKISEGAVRFYKEKAGVINKLDDLPQIKYAPLFDDILDTPIKSPFDDKERWPERNNSDNARELSKSVRSTSDSVSKEPKNIFCSNCGNRMVYGSRFCSICGNRIQYAYEQAKDDASDSSSFDWSSVIDEPFKREIPDIKSPWADDSDHAFIEWLRAEKEEKKKRADDSNAAASDGKRTMSFIDVLNAEKEEKKKRADETTFEVPEIEGFSTKPVFEEPKYDDGEWDDDFGNKMEDQYIDEDALFAEMEETRPGKTGTGMTIAAPVDSEEEIKALRKRLMELTGTGIKHPDGGENHTSDPDSSFDVSKYFDGLTASSVKPEDIYLDVLPEARAETESKILNFEESKPEYAPVDESSSATKVKSSDTLSLEELERDLFGEPQTCEVEYEETKKIDKFYELYRKNEEFQRLLDEEYNKLKGNGFAQTTNTADEQVAVEPSVEEPKNNKAVRHGLNTINCVDSVTIDEIRSKLEEPIYEELKSITGKKDPVIHVIGVGGCGCKTIDSMIDADLQGVTFIGVNTDKQALSKCKAEIKIQLGKKLLGGRGAGANSEISQKAAEESIDEIISHIQDADMVFIIAGMGGGTGTGAAPVIAKAAMDCGVLTVAVVTKPFTFEGKKRWNRAEKGILYLSNFVDSLVVTPNDWLIDNSAKGASTQEAFDILNDVLIKSIQSILFQP